MPEAEPDTIFLIGRVEDGGVVVVEEWRGFWVSESACRDALVNLYDSHRDFTLVEVDNAGEVP